MTEITRHFTATTFIVRGDAVLLHRHAKQGLWLPPGGHIERDELPHDAALREIEEETGLGVQLHSSAEAAALGQEMACLVVPQPAFILVEDINPFHQHIDFTYYAEASDASVTNVGYGHGFRWLTVAELEDMDGVPQNVKVGARMAIAHFEKRLEDTRREWGSGSLPGGSNPA